MQKDFHHAVIYVLSRLAGFEKKKAEIIAHSSQYVDDEVRNDVVYFDTGAIYKPICSSHKMFDQRNFNVLANHLSWMPFHFLPGDRLDLLKNAAQRDFEERVVCIKDSPIARDMIEECFKQRGTPHFLHRLGVTLHVYADTWAHQKFSGIQSAVNKVKYLDDKELLPTIFTKVIDAVKDFFVSVARVFINEVMPLGHGAALTYPDLPFLTWKYRDYKGTIHTRNNVDEFMDAVHHLYTFLVKCRRESGTSEDCSLNEKDVQAIRTCFANFTDENGDIRHQKWIDSIADGIFSFGKEQIRYTESGKSSWEYLALGDQIKCIKGRTYYKFTDDFMTSNWKFFHDALSDHQYFMNRQIFPKYQLCLA